MMLQEIHKLTGFSRYTEMPIVEWLTQMKIVSEVGKPVLVSWREAALIGLALVLIAIASQQQSVSLKVSPDDVQPVHLTPDTPTKSSATNSA